jgi:hypothetical protein
VAEGGLGLERRIADTQTEVGTVSGGPRGATRRILVSSRGLDFHDKVAGLGWARLGPIVWASFGRRRGKSLIWVLGKLVNNAEARTSWPAFGPKSPRIMSELAGSRRAIIAGGLGALGRPHGQG